MWKFSSFYSLSTAVIKLLCLKKYRLTALEVLFSLFLHVKKSVSAQSTSIISHTFDEILEIYKKYCSSSNSKFNNNFFFHLLYSHSLTRHINKYSVKRNERNVIFERIYLTNWIFLSSSSSSSLSKFIKI